MLEYVVARIKVTFIITLFFAPVFAAAWNKQLDEWLRQNHRYEGSNQVLMQTDLPRPVNAAR